MNKLLIFFLLAIVTCEQLDTSVEDAFNSIDVEKSLEETYSPQREHLASVDLRQSFSVIRNQGKLGSCTSFSVASIFEYILNEGSVGKKSCLSPRFLYYNVCDKNSDNSPIDKGSSFYAKNSIKTHFSLRKFCHLEK